MLHVAPVLPEKGNQFAGAQSHVYASCADPASAVRLWRKTIQAFCTRAEWSVRRRRSMRGAGQRPLGRRATLEITSLYAKPWSKRPRLMVETLPGAKGCAAGTGGKVANNQPRLKARPDKLSQPTRFAARRAW